MKKRECTICVAKTKVLISGAVTARLICDFVYAYADCWFSYAAAQILQKSMCFKLYKKSQYIQHKQHYWRIKLNIYIWHVHILGSL